MILEVWGSNQKGAKHFWGLHERLKFVGWGIPHTLKLPKLRNTVLDLCKALCWGDLIYALFYLSHYLFCTHFFFKGNPERCPCCFDLLFHFIIIIVRIVPDFRLSGELLGSEGISEFLIFNIWPANIILLHYVDYILSPVCIHYHIYSILYCGVFSSNIFANIMLGHLNFTL